MSFDDFDSQIQPEELHDHDPNEICSGCDQRVIDCECEDWIGDDDGQPDLQQEYHDLYSGEDDFHYESWQDESDLWHEC